MSPASVFYRLGLNYNGDSYLEPMDTVDPFSIPVDQLGEAGLLRILQSYAPAEIIGDDAAVLKPRSGDLVVTTDVLVETVHFSDQTTPADAVGWRATAANLSDLAAMGAEPDAIVVGLGVPGQTCVSWVQELYSGLHRCCEHYQTRLVGGDTCRAAFRFVSITALGYVQPDQEIRRRGARPGDHILVSGPHGSSRAGLEILLNPHRSTHLNPQQQQELIRAHQYPKPRFDVVAALRALGVDPIGGMDSSDGLADALIQICRASGVSAVIDPDRIPMSEALQVGFPEQSRQWALYGGEDFELVLSVPEPVARELIERVEGMTRIGEIVASNTTGEVEVKGLGRLSQDLAFQHFSPT